MLLKLIMFRKIHPLPMITPTLGAPSFNTASALPLLQYPLLFIKHITTKIEILF